MFDLVPGSKGFPRRKAFRDLDQIFDLMDFELPEMETMDIKVDIKEDDKNYLIQAELPGVNKEDIDLEIADNILSIQVERKEESKEEKENYIRKERRYGNFKRSFYIDNVDLEKIDAELDDGILEINLPKKTRNQEQVKTIKID